MINELCSNDHKITCIYSAIWIGIILLFIVPFEIYVTIKFFAHRRHPAIQTRYPMVIITTAIFSIIHSLICEIFYHLSLGIHMEKLNAFTAKFITNIIFPPFLLAIGVLISFRIYLIHYNTNYAVAQSTLQWQSLLSDAGYTFVHVFMFLLNIYTHNVQKTVPAKDYYSRNRATLGNSKYVSRYFIIYFFVAAFLEIAATACEHPKLLHSSHYLSKALYVLCLTILIIFCAYLLFKTPKFEDTYFVRIELKYLLNLWLFVLILYVVSCAITHNLPIFEQIETTSLTICNFGQVLISEWIILNKILKNDGYKPSGHRTIASRISIAFKRNPLKNDKRRSETVNTTKLFNVLISSSIGIELFIQHVRSEFAFENLLSFIEMIQWIYFATDRKFDSFDIKPLHKIEYEFASIIPLSSANNSEEWKWDESILLIYAKYICVSADLQINLPFALFNMWSELIRLLKIKIALKNKTYVWKHKAIPTPMAKKAKSTFGHFGALSFLRKRTYDNSKQDKSASLLFEIPEDKESEAENPTPIPESLSTPDDINNNNLNPQWGSSTKRSRSRAEKQARKTALKIETTTLNSAPSSNEYHIVAMQSPMMSIHSHEAGKLDHELDMLVMLDEEYKKNDETTSTNSKDPELSSLCIDKEEITLNDLYKLEMVNIEKTIESAFDPGDIDDLKQTDTQRTCTVSFNLDTKMDTARSTSLKSVGSAKSVSFNLQLEDEHGHETKLDAAGSAQTESFNKLPMTFAISGTKTTERDKRFRADTDRTDTAGTPRSLASLGVPSMYKNNQSLTVPAPRKLTNQSSIVQSVRKSFRKIGALISHKSKSSTLQVPRKGSVSTRGNEERKINDLYVEEWKETERAKALGVGEFVSVVAQSISEILNLNYQSVGRFKRSARFMKFCESVNLEQLIEQYGDKGVYD